MHTLKSKCLHHSLQALPHFGCKLLYFGLADKLKHGIRIHKLDVDFAHSVLSDNYVARQKEAD